MLFHALTLPRARTRAVPLLAALTLLALGCSLRGGKVGSTALAPPTAEKMAELWVEPPDITARDLFHGPGGPDLMPKPGSSFRFKSKDTKGYSWGWQVVDDKGMEWSVKYGPEAHSEVFASRIVWALGYHQVPTYHVTNWVLTGGPEPGPKQPSRFRPDLPGWRRSGTWSWRQNEFVGTDPYDGLLVLMRVLNNWDLLDRNAAIFELPEPLEGARRWYVAIDLGAALGRTRIVPVSGTRSDAEDFEAQGYIKGVDDKGRVRFDDLGRWHRELFEDLTPADVRWASERLQRLTQKQWDDAFRAAAYKEDDARRFHRKIQEKIAQGLALAPQAASVSR
jgi:hypothetical protein